MNRLRGTLLSMFPALERTLELTNVGPLVLLTGYQTPAAIRRAGVARLTKWLAKRKVRNAKSLAETVVEAAERQYTSVPGEKTIAKLVHTLAEEVMALNERVAGIEKLIEGRFREHDLADIVQSVPGIGVVLGAEFLAGVGGSLDTFDSPDALAAFAGVAPAPKDSGKVSGNHHRPHPVPPQTPTRLLHLRAGQHPLRPELPRVLRPKARRGQAARPGRGGSGPPTRQRPVGPDS